MIALLKKELRFLEPELEFEGSTCRFVQRGVLEEAVKTEKSCGFKTNELCVFVGTVQGDGQALEFVQEREELNMTAVQIDAKIARSQKGIKTKEAGNDKYSEKESSDIVEHFMQTESLCMNAGDDDMLQQCYKEIALLEYLLINSEYDR